jgi:hypothetical protein
MTSFYTIPLQPNPQTLTITLSGVVYNLALKYQNVPMGGWTLDINDINNNPILQGIPLVVGANLLHQYQYLNPGWILRVQTTSDTNEVPTFTNLGTDGLLYWVTNP